MALAPEFLASLLSEEGTLHGDLSEIVAKIARSRRFYFPRRKAVKALFRGLMETGTLKAVKVHFTLCPRRYAYMRDDGNVFFDVCMLRGRRGGFVARVILHETAHLVLSRRGDYGTLKGQEAEFLASPHAKEALSPIEYAATMLSIVWMERIMEKGADALAEQIDAERAKLAASDGPQTVVLNGS